MCVKPSGILDGFCNGFAILQLKDTADQKLHFLGFRHLADEMQMVPDIENYEVRYEKNLADDFEISGNYLPAFLEKLYYIFNVQHPEDFKGHSLSVGDVVAIKHNGTMSYHYVDIVCFVPLVDFEKPVVKIDNWFCHLVDEFQLYDGNIMQVGTFMDSDRELSYFAEVKSCDYFWEYDPRPSREEMEDDYIAEMAERAVDEREAEVGAILGI